MTAKNIAKQNKAKKKLKYFELKRNDYLALFFLLVFAFVLYGNSIPNDYALDDTIVISGNEFTKSGVKGIKDILSNDAFTGYYGKDNNMVAGGRYRPLSLVTFALEVELFGQNPHINHFFNVVFYFLTCAAIYLFLLYLFKQKLSVNQNKWYLTVPFIATVLFMVHPVHTEVVANIKGRDEILTMLFSVCSLFFYMIYLDKKKIWILLTATVSFFLALISKENAATFLLIIPLTIYFFTNHKIKVEYKSFIPYIVAFVIFLILRQATAQASKLELVDDLMNNPFIGMSFSQKYSTIFYTLGQYFKLMLFPYPLTYDYYPFHVPVVNFGELKSLIPLLIYLAITGLAIWKFKSKSVYVYSILFFLITLSIVSNLFFPIGVFMNERFLFISSFGFLLAIAIIFSEEIPKLIKNVRIYQIGTTLILILIITGFSIQVISRNKVWKDNYTLFTNDVKVSSNSAKGTSLAGEYLIYEAQKTRDPAKKDSLYKLSISYLEKAVEIYPKHVLAWFNLAAANFERNRNYPEAVKAYKKLLAINPNGDKIFQFLFVVLNTCNDIDYKLKVFKEIREINPARFDINNNVANLLMGKKDYSEAVNYFNSALKAEPQNFDALCNLGFCYFQQKNYEGSLNAFLKAEKIKPDDKPLLNNISSAYMVVGNMSKAEEYKHKAIK